MIRKEMHKLENIGFEETFHLISRHTLLDIRSTISRRGEDGINEYEDCIDALCLHVSPFADKATNADLDEIKKSYLAIALQYDEKMDQVMKDENLTLDIQKQLKNQIDVQKMKERLFYLDLIFARVQKLADKHQWLIHKIIRGRGV